MLLIELTYAFIFVIIAVLIAYREKLGIEKKILYVSILALIQLFILGFVLLYIFSFGMIGAFLMISVMIILASYLIMREINLENKTKLFISLFITFLTTTIVSLAILVIPKVIKFEPIYVIPLMGMVIGNTMNTVHLALDKIIDLVKSERDILWGYLALGATEIEALRPFIKNAVKSAVIPQMNRTKSVGVIFIPGAMVGMLLSGANPLYAAEIQIIIMWMILSSAVISGVLICYLMYKEIIRV
ncbi:ABC transporter related protein [Methanocaldococcus bathoardescens]|uniref:ABC transporter related protein n=1 Tax=Methanocaldococcus bathoardescens TaxID=1301915 RepID=A0A076LCB6_9EURY|nr:iron export ABC transporter permease subunit FetB [Methanocaldococcus bathoardescens]AIJ06130.1 ABC transporter related protein [Methanocaldococcus bathoardescens]